MKKPKKNEQFKLPKPVFGKNGLASPKLSDRLMGRSQYYAGVGWVKPRDSVKVLNRGVPVKRPKFKHNWQVKHRLGNWINRPRFPLSWFGNKKFVLGIVMLAMILGGITIVNGPAFHGNRGCTNEAKKPPGAPCIDPTQVIWQEANSNLNDFQTFGGLTTGACTSIAGTNCMFFANNGTSSQVALTKITIGDLAVASKSLLAFHNTWQLSSLGLNSGSTWGWFLTSNKTITKATFYNPDNDPSVVLHAKYTCNSGCGGGTPSIGITTKFLRTTGQSDTVSSEDTGNCSQSGSDFLCNILPDPALNNVFDSAFYLNYTGIVNGNSCTVSGNPGIIGPAPGCSWLLNEPLSGNGQSQYWVNTQTLPWFQLQSNQYYLGFYTLTNVGVQVEWTFNAGTSGNMDSFQAVFLATAPTIDTGGFFGPVIKALIIIGVFVLQSVVTFFTFVVGIVKVALDTIGGFVGLGAIGTALFTILAAAGNFISNVITVIGGQLANIVGFIGNAASAIVAFLSSGSSFIWTQVSNFFALWAFVFPLFNTIFLVFTAFSQNGVQLAQYALIFWWLYGIFVVLEQGTDKWWNHWVGMGEESFKKVFNLGYWMIELSFHWLVWLKNLLAQWV